MNAKGKITAGQMVFESLCENNGILCCRIPETNRPMPDYEVLLHGQKALVEVKDVIPNTEEENGKHQLLNNGYFVSSSLVGKRASFKIKDAVKQLMEAKRLQLPGILVIYDTRIHDGISEEDLLSAMFGHQRLGLSPSNTMKSMGRSGGRLGPGKYDQVSAVGLLRILDGQPWLHLQPNWFAAFPLPLEKGEAGSD